MAYYCFRFGLKLKDDKRHSRRLNQPTESSQDSGESTDEEYQSYLTMLWRRHNETSNDD
ncbi:hypothetical protein PIB30_080784 [Stylosanthes scabra]|uniref:Uncharacterized protein n=1 Tax=Stylosanthes scabra TaxID=79078 RepID=A0ABU6WT38_9FABA|nr:hypothetical protein [Stylosanthes scabra]